MKVVLALQWLASPFDQPVKSGLDQLIRVENDNRSSANVKGEYVTIPRKFKIEVVYNKAF